MPCSVARRTVEIGRQRVRRSSADDHPQSPQPATKGGARLHIDVNATDHDQGAELEHLVKLGARPAAVGQTGEESWHVLADPEGNQFRPLGARLEPL